MKGGLKGHDRLPNTHQNLWAPLDCPLNQPQRGSLQEKHTQIVQNALLKQAALALLRGSQDWYNICTCISLSVIVNPLNVASKSSNNSEVQGVPVSKNWRPLLV